MACESMANAKANHTGALFLDHQVATDTAAAVDKARLAVRRAQRYTTKAESKAGQEANRALHEAEAALDEALKKLA